MATHDLIYKIFKPLDLAISAWKGGKMLEVGTTAPDFSVTDHHGKTVSLKGLQGKKVVLWFYPKADTPGCTAEG